MLITILTSLLSEGSMQTQSWQLSFVSDENIYIFFVKDFTVQSHFASIKGSVAAEISVNHIRDILHFIWNVL